MPPSHRTRKDMPQELRALQERLRVLLRANMGEARRTHALLRETEQKVEDRFGHLDFIETAWYNAAKKFRKERVQPPLQNDGIRQTNQPRSAPVA
jgi:hypothetical protein